METKPLNATWNSKLDPGTEKGHNEKTDEIQIKSLVQCTELYWVGQKVPEVPKSPMTAPGKT